MQRVTEQTATLKEFAALIGVKPSYVTKLKQAGRLVLTDDGRRVSVEASKARIEETAGAHHEGVREHWRGKRRAAAAPKEGAPDETKGPAGETPAPPDETREPRYDSKAYWDRREAAARAKLREIELAEKEGRSVDIDVIRNAGTEVGATLRAALENLPDQLAPALVAITDEGKIHALLVEHIEAVLNDVAAKLTAVGELKSNTQQQEAKP